MTDTVERDAYAVLGVAQDADDETIASAFRTLARRFHPDVAGDAATRPMIAINAAYEAIRTAECRAGYTGIGGAPVMSASASPGGSTSPTPPADYHRRDRLHWSPERDGTGGAGSPPGHPSGSVLDFGRHIGWSLGEIARVDPGYLVWLTEKAEGRPFLQEISALLGQTDHVPAEADRGWGVGHGVFRR